MRCPTVTGPVHPASCCVTLGACMLCTSSALRCFFCNRPHVLNCVANTQLVAIAVNRFYTIEQPNLQTGESLDVRVLREGQPLDLKFQLKQRRPLVPILHGVDCVPSYFIVGGLVFVPLSIPFLEHAYGGTHAILEHSCAHCLNTLCHR